MGGDPRLSYMQQIGTSGRAASHVLVDPETGPIINSIFCPHAHALNICEPVSDAREPLSAFCAGKRFLLSHKGLKLLDGDFTVLIGIDSREDPLVNGRHLFK